MINSYFHTNKQSYLSEVLPWNYTATDDEKHEYILELFYSILITSCPNNSGSPSLKTSIFTFMTSCEEQWIKKVNRYPAQTTLCNKMANESTNSHVNNLEAWHTTVPQHMMLSLMCSKAVTWWRHQMETFSESLVLCAGNSPVPGEFPTQRPVTRSFDVYFDLRPDKLLSKQLWGWWFETLWHSLWRHRNDADNGHSR